MRIKIDAADKAFSLYIRRRDNWTCQRCGRRYEEGDAGLNCAHYWNRWREGTRFEPDNCVALCFGCPKLLDGDERERFTEILLKRLGKDRLLTLELQARSYKKKDRKMSLIISNKLLEELNEISTRNVL